MQSVDFYGDAKKVFQKTETEKVIDEIYNIIISDIPDRIKVLKIQDYIFNKKGIDNCESERV